MTLTTMLIPSTVTSTSSLLQNLPTPAGDTWDTFSRDYDQERFFRVAEKDVSSLGRTVEPSAIFKLHGVIDMFLGELDQEQTIEWFDPNPPNLAMAKSISQAMTNWLYVDPGFHIVPLKFNVLETDVSQEVLHFCFIHGILPHVSTAMDLLDKIFSPLQNLSLRQEKDPETEEEWITLNFTVTGQTNEILDKYDKYTDEWVSLVPWLDRDKIRMAYNVI